MQEVFLIVLLNDLGVMKVDFDFNKFNSEQLDIFKEISTIGAGNAATSLSKLLGKRITMSVPSAKVLDFSQIGKILGNEDEIIAGVVTPFTGDVEGMILFILKFDDALNIINTLTKKTYKDLQTLDEYAVSAIKETGNILSGTYISALSSLTKLKIDCRYPNVSIDMAGAILSLPAISFANISENCLYIDSSFLTRDEDDNSKINANIFLVPDANSFENLLKVLGV